MKEDEKEHLIRDLDKAFEQEKPLTQILTYGKVLALLEVLRKKGYFDKDEP